MNIYIWVDKITGFGHFKEFKSFEDFVKRFVTLIAYIELKSHLF